LNSKRDPPIYANIGFSEIPGLKAGDFLFNFSFPVNHRKVVPIISYIYDRVDFVRNGSE
jgi:hypothetical protein